MMFYKIVFNDMIIDVIRNPVWVIWLSRSGRFLNTDPGTANGVVSRDGSTVYNIIGKSSFVNYTNQFKTVDVVEITENEYNNLMSQITGENIEVENHEPTEIEILQKRVADLEAYTRDVSVCNNNLAEQLEATKILLGVE